MNAQPYQNGNMRVFIAADRARTTGLTLASPGALGNGEVVITDLGMNVLDTTTVLSQDQVLIVQGRGTNEELLISAPLNYRDIIKYEGRQFAARTEKVDYVGYNPITGIGSIDTINSNDYRLNIYFQDQTPSMQHGLYMGVRGWYNSDSTATATEVALGTYNDIVDKLAKWKHQKQIRPELVNSQNTTVTASTVASGSVTFTPGSNVVTFTVANNGDTQTVGDFIRVGLGLTDEVYRIEQLIGTTQARINRPFQEATSTTLTATNYEFILAANVGNFGIRFTGLDREFDVDERPLSIVTWQTSLINFGTTTVTNAVSPTTGHGTYRHVATMEHASWGVVGQIFHLRQLLPRKRFLDAVSTQNYSTITLSWSKIVGSTTRTELPGSITIACALDNNVANTFDTNIRGGVQSVADVLDAWITNFTSLSAQAFNL